MALLMLTQTIKAEVRIHGVSKALEQQIMADLSIANATSGVTVDTVEAQHAQAESEILTALESQGYYEAEVDSELILPDRVSQVTPLNAKDWLARYTIYLGKPIRIRQVDIQIQGEGSEEPTLKSLLRHSTVRTGEVLSHRAYENLKEALLARALQLGYLDAAITQGQIAIDRKRHVANITLNMVTEQPYYLGDCHFVDPPYPMPFLERYPMVQPGDRYGSEALSNLQRNFSGSELFNKVQIQPRMSERQDQIVPIDILLSPKPQNSYLTSLGYGTDTGPRGRLAWEHRQQHYPGHRVLMELKASRVLRQAGIAYVVPGPRPATDQLRLGSQVIEEFLRDDKYSRRHDVSVQDFRKRGSTDYLTTLAYTGETFRDLPTDPKKQAHYLLPSVSLIWNQGKQEPERERQYGTRLQVTARGAMGILLSNTNFLQLEAKAKWIHLLGSESRLLLRAEMGTTLARKNEEIPLSLRFFTGGDSTIRGYAYKSLGPKQVDRNGDLIVVGGRYLSVISTEFETRLYQKLSGAVFMDAGNAMNHWRDPWVLGAGVGVRYATPIGLLRLDVAKPIAKGKQRPRLHLSFGMDL